MDTVQINTFSVDQSVMPDHMSSMLDENMSEASYSYDTLFPSLPENEVKVDVPAPDLGLWNQKMKLKSSVITQVFRVPFEERKFHDMNSQRFGEQGGEQAKICTDIIQRTGAHIEISSSKDQSLTILVTGKEESVFKARRLIVKELQQQAQVNIPIPKEHHRFILGKNGKKLLELEQTTVTKISVPRSDENLDLIRITGTKDGIDRARHEIQLISDEQAKLSFERLNIPKYFHPFIVGPYGECVNAIMRDTGARINIPPPSVMKDELTIAGEKEGVASAKLCVLQIYEEKKRICQTVSVEVPKNQHRYIIGPRGQTIQEILKETGVSVEMPSSDIQSDTITLRGPQEKLGPALTLVYEKANSIKTEIVQAPSWLHKYIIGKKGVNIQNIQERTQSCKNTHVEFSNNQDIIKVEGPPGEIKELCKELQKLTEELLLQLDFKELTVDPNYHRHIIGKNGANIKRIKQENSDVQIHIPTDADVTKVIRIEGDREGVARAKQELLEMVDKMENEVTREIHIEQRFHKNIIGTRGEKIKALRDQYNQVNITCPEPGLRSDKVILRGPKEDVDACASNLQQYHHDLKIKNFCAEVRIYKQNHKFIIGKGGANIRKIRDETNTKIELPAAGSDSDVIVICGRKEDVLLAEKKILEIQNELDNIFMSEIMIPAKLHNSIIGTKGRLIRSIANDCGGVTIRFPMENSASDKVSIRGIKEDVQKAKKILLDLASEKQMTGYTAEIKAKPEQHKFLIGKNGANIKRVRENTGARIIFPNQSDDDRDTITIIGREEEVEAAKKELMATISELDKIVESTINVDPMYHQHFVTRNGEIVRQIGDDFGGVSISFPRNGTHVVSLKGLENCVEGAKQRILEIVEDLKQMKTIECVIPQRHHRTMMGIRGSKVQALRQQHNVQIKFPEKENKDEEISMNGDYVEEEDTSLAKKCDTIYITGKPENCEAAKLALEGLIPVTEEMQVPYDLHRFIIGQKGKDVRSMMEAHDVNISIPHQSDESDMIKITGTPSSVKSAIAAMKERIEQLEAGKQDRLLRSYKTTVVVDPQYHPKIIGRGGVVVTKIKQDHNVTINFPDKDSDNVIEVIGYEKDAEAAKEAILKIVQDEEEKYREEVKIDPRVHSRIIGTRGRNISKIMNDFRVEIKFPRGMGNDLDLVMISGNSEDVLDAKDHLLNLEEECLQDMNEKEFMRTYTQPPSRFGGSDNDSFLPKEFVVTGAPWDKKKKAAPDTSNTEEFPSFGSPGEMPPPKPIAWGPTSRR